MPMVNPKRIDLSTEEIISRKDKASNTCTKKVVRLTFSFTLTFRNDPIKPTKSVYITKIGIIKVVANTLVTTKYLKGLVAETSIASICSVTFIDPSSAPILDPTLPAAIRAVTKGPMALTIAIAINAGSQDEAPNSAKDGRDWFVNTIPTIKPVKEINGKELYPI